MYYDWFFDAFDRMPKEGREMQWRALSEADAPEQINKIRLPDNADEYYTPLQRLLVIRLDLIIFQFYSHRGSC